MEFSRKIVIQQNPNFRKSQILQLYNSLVKRDWYPFDENGYVHFKLDNEEMQSLPADDKGISKQLSEVEKAQEHYLPISIQFLNKTNKRHATLLHQKNEYIFHLEIENSDNQNKLFKEFHLSIKNSIPESFHLNKIEWISNPKEEVVRLETEMYHEGVLILASSKRLIQYFKDRKFNYDYPTGISELIRQKIIIAVDSKDYDYTTILEKENVEKWEFGYFNVLEFESNDELLILHHGDFTMICDKHNGDYKSYGWKHIISIPIEHAKEQVILIAKPEDRNDKRLIFQFKKIERKLKRNFLVNYEEIPTHNKA